ncbi:hypothetical protein [Shewanella cyperi]|uniref:hypothetical protein n=1 Tax=Shewanella cyperi TaxID=2814292 RepID=UPI001A94EE5F|nr:hypothetical protein [Shewanella cyperi]QSX40343.1 hypothetical protein JYB84_15470 [Shewanella cyperi]
MDKEAWKKAAFETVVKVAESKEEFTPDDIWDAGLPKPLEARWLGPVMNAVKREGIIEKTGRVQPTRQKESHGCDVTIWKSNIYTA